MNKRNQILIFSFLTTCLTAYSSAQPHSANEIKPPPAATYQHFEHWLLPTSGKITTQFHVGQNGNNGVDFSGVEGQPIVAVADGQVLYVGNHLKGYENLIIIKHNNIFRSAYSNNQQILVKEHQFVKAGQTIATMGSSNKAPPQLHFEIRKNGVPVDPTSYLPNNPTQ